MTRYIKVLGLAVVAVLAMSAVAAAGAQAQSLEFTAFNTATGLHETAIGTATSEEGAGGKQVFTASIAAVECYHVHAEATLPGGTGKELTVTNIKYEGNETKTTEETCQTTAVGQKFVTHINMNGCHYVFHAGEEVGAEKTGTVDIVCPEGGPITIKVTKEPEVVKCTLKVPAQNGLKHVLYSQLNTGGSPTRTDVTVEADVKEITYESEGGLLNCGTANGKHEGAKGATYTGNSIVSAVNEKGAPLDVEVNP